MKLIALYVLLVSVLVVRNAEAQGIGGFFSAIANFFRRRPGTSSSGGGSQVQLQQQQAALIEAQLQDQVNQALQLQAANQQDPQTIVVTDVVEVTVTEIETSFVNIDRFTVVTETQMELATVTQTSLMAMHTVTIHHCPLNDLGELQQQQTDDAVLIENFLQPSNLLAVESTETPVPLVVKRSADIESSAQDYSAPLIRRRPIRSL